MNTIFNRRVIIDSQARILNKDDELPCKQRTERKI